MGRRLFEEVYAPLSRVPRSATHCSMSQPLTRRADRYLRVLPFALRVSAQVCFVSPIKPKLDQEIAGVYFKDNSAQL